jgi:Carboxypeptidase regulatory-like domain
MAVAYRTILFSLALATPLAARAQISQPEIPPPAMIEGSVIDAQNNRSVPRATVKLMGLKGAGSKSTRADGNGHFIFEQVEPGRYKLIAEHQGFFSDERKREYQPTFDVASGGHLKNMPVRLMPTAVVAGEIVDEFDEPIQKIEVKLLAVKIRLGQMYLSPAGKTITNDRGEYRLAGLRPGRYYLVAEYEHSGISEEVISQLKEVLTQNTTTRVGGETPMQIGAAPSEPEAAFSYPPQFYPATGDFQQAQAIALSAGDEVAANFLLISASVVSIRGRVTNGMTGAPAEKAAVSAYWTPYMEDDGIPAKTSPEKGAFEVRGVAPGTYTLRASFTEDGQSFMGEQTVEVGNRGAQNVEIPALPDFVGAGHVAIIGTPRNPINRLSADFAGEGLMPRVHASATSPQFKFETQLRPDQRYHANIPNLPDDYYLKSVVISGHEVPPDNVVVNGRRGDIELILSPSGGHIEGVLFDAQGQPTRGSVLLVPDVPQPGPPDLFRRTGADTKGKFTLRGVVPGSYRLIAMESVDLDTEINAPDFLRNISNRGDSLIVDEQGKYTVSLKLSDSKELGQ